MDYETKPTSRKDLRRLATYVRKMFDVPEGGPFPVLDALEKLPDIFEGSSYQIVEDMKLPPQTMARCTSNDSGGFTIEMGKSFAHLTLKEKAMVEHVTDIWKGKKSNVWSRWKQKQQSG